MPRRNTDQEPADPGLDAYAALAATSHAVIVTDATRPDGPIVFANDAFRLLTGYSQAEILGRNCRFLQGIGTDPLAVAEIRLAVASGQSLNRRILNYRKDGTSFWNDLTIDPIHDAAGQVTGFIGLQMNSDAIHLADEASTVAESELRGIASDIPGYIFRRVMRPDATIEMVYCSPSLSSMLGITQADATKSFYNYVHPDDHGALNTAIRSSAADMSVFREEFRLVSTTGTVHWLRSEAPPRRTDGGEIVWDGIAIEISAEKRWKTEIAQLALAIP